MAKQVKVLLIEDDPVLSEMYESMFDLEGFKTTKASNGKEGLEALGKEVPDIILLDILMPGMNGFEFLKEIKKESNARTIPVLLLTNLGESKIDMNKELAFALGIEGYLIKAKNTPDQVVAKIKSVLADKTT